MLCQTPSYCCSFSVSFSFLVRINIDSFVVIILLQSRYRKKLFSGFLEIKILYILNYKSGTVNQIGKDLVNLLPESSSKKNVSTIFDHDLFFFEFGL